MAAAAGGGDPEGPAGAAHPSPGAPGESPEPEVLAGPGEPAEPRPEVPPGPARPGPEEVEPPWQEEPSEPEVAAVPPDPGATAAAPAAGGAVKEEEEEEQAEAGSGAGAAGAAPDAARSGEVPGPPSPAVSGGAERRSGEAASEAPAERDVAEETEEERRERAALLAELGELADERERLRQAGARLQLRLGELLRPGQGERRRAAASGDGAQLYGQRLRELQDGRERREREAAACRERVAARRRVVEERRARARAEWDAFQARKKAVTVSVLGRRLGGRAAATEVVDGVQAREEAKEQRLREARVENIKLEHEIENLESILKAQEELVEGQQFTDLEHIKKENQKHCKKIDTLSDEILKLRRKLSNTVCILSQFKEKMQFVEAENQCRKAELMDMENALSQKRDILTKTKQTRDKLQRNNLNLQQKCGLLGNEALLQDFEEKVDAVELLSQQLETLKRHYAGLVSTCRGIQKKLKEANSYFLPEDD